MCQGNMELSSNVDYSWHYPGIIKFRIKEGTNIILDLERDNFEIQMTDLEYRDNDFTTHSYSSPIYSQNDDGTIFLGVSNACVRNDYSYTFGLCLDVHQKKCKLLGVFLNSEGFVIKKGEDTYKIRNLYTSQKTLYSYVSNNNPSLFRDASIPLVSLDLERPQNTIDRIKNLLIYT